MARNTIIPAPPGFYELHVNHQGEVVTELLIIAWRIRSDEREMPNETVTLGNEPCMIDHDIYDIAVECPDGRIVTHVDGVLPNREAWLTFVKGEAKDREL